MPRRVNMPPADELFRKTTPDVKGAGAAPADPQAGPSGRVKHSEKMTVYLTSEELLALEQARLKLRADLGKYDLYGLGEEERKALLRVQRGTGLIRLGVPPENITLDASLAHLTFVATTTTTKKDGTKTKPTKKQEEGLQNAATLLRDCRRLGAPGEVEDAKTPAATSRRGRSAP